MFDVSSQSKLRLRRKQRDRVVKICGNQEQKSKHCYDHGILRGDDDGSVKYLINYDHSPVSQVTPVKPAGHVQTNLSNRLSQVAPL